MIKMLKKLLSYNEKEREIVIKVNKQKEERKKYIYICMYSQ